MEKYGVALEESSKYFTPDIEDIRAGYEFEVYRKRDNTWWDSRTIFREVDLNFILEKLKENKIRVPYLTKEQIEAEGWLYKGKTQDIWFEKELNYDMGSWTAYKVIMQYGIGDKRLRIFAVDIVDKVEYDCFRGECKDINTFRYICKLLKI